MPSCSGCGSGTHLDVTNSTIGTADQQIQAAWQVSDICAEAAELRTAASRSKTSTPAASDRSPGGRGSGWTRKAARATLDIAVEERESQRALLKNRR
jgi:hypothetical protein